MGRRVYQLNGEHHVADWLADELDPQRREAMLNFLVELSYRPEEVASAVRRREASGHHLYVARVPGTDAFIDYLIVDQFTTVMILSVLDVPLPES